MKIAFFTPGTFSKKLGASKNRIELAEALKAIGWETSLIGNSQLNLDEQNGYKKAEYNTALKDYLIAHAHQFDVVLYEYNSLPFDRSLFSPKTLFIARPALLHYNSERVKIPVSLKARLSRYYHKFLRLIAIEKKDNDQIYAAEITLSQCDLIQVQNTLDVKLLLEKGHNKDKIVLVPNGLSSERLNLFNSIKIDYKGPLKIAFVGTFDFRKGAMDFAYIVEKVLNKYPDCTFKFIGTKGLFRTESEILNFFNRRLRSSIEIIQTFEPLDLPLLLSDCQAGIFPSYFESFGFGALEMMAAGLPVVSYKSPGPSDFIIEELLVPIGNKKLLTEKLINILSDKDNLMKLAVKAKAIAREYNWNKIALNSAEIYKKHHYLLSNKENG